MSLNITVNSTYKITSDSMNVIVNRKHLVDPTKSPRWTPDMSAELREEWREVAYCRTLEQALNWLVEQQTRDSNAESLAELLNEIKGFQREISAVLNG